MLAAVPDERATAVLQQAWLAVQSQAAKINNPELRAALLRNVPVNRELRPIVAQQA